MRSKQKCFFGNHYRRQNAIFSNAKKKGQTMIPVTIRNSMIQSKGSNSFPRRQEKQMMNVLKRVDDALYFYGDSIFLSQFLQKILLKIVFAFLLPLSIYDNVKFNAIYNTK